MAMAGRNELVEEPVQTGSSFKATSKQELLKVLNGENKVWRIDLSLAAKIACREYFHEQFDPDVASVLEEATRVIYIDVDQSVLEERRIKRDGPKYNPDEYRERDMQEMAILSTSYEHFDVKLPNPDGELEQTTEKLLKIVSEFLS
jgi:hypothetical protein